MVNNIEKMVETLFAFFHMTKPVKNKYIYEQAFRHKSICPEEDSYERLEFLGDSVLHVIVSEYLYERYDNEDQGFLTRLRMKIENCDSLARIAKCLGFNKYISIEKELITDSILEDVVEAFIGATFLENGLNFTKKLMIAIIEEYNDLSNLLYYDDNYKDILLRYFHQKNLGNPIYECHGREQQKFKMIVKDKNNNILGIAFSYNKQKAEQYASRDALINVGVMVNDVVDPDWFHDMKNEKTTDLQFDKDGRVKKFSRYNHENVLINKYSLGRILASYSIYWNNVTKNKNMYIEALTHRSYLYRENQEEDWLDKLEAIRSPQFRYKSNERLLFLGNTIIKLILTMFIYTKYPRKSEGFLTKLRIKLENKFMLSDIMIKSGLNKYILFSTKIEKDMNGRMNVNITSGAFEAFFGAVYLDIGLIKTYEFLIKIFTKEINIDEIAQQETNFKDLLIIAYYRNDFGCPLYELAKTSGPDHSKLFTMIIRHPKTSKILAHATSSSKKEAEKMVAKMAFYKL